MRANESASKAMRAAVEEMERTCFSGDTEKDHIAADAILTAFLREMGFSDLADLYDTVAKWYA